ncbi:decaprenyl-phosphate phosphoribosyltransferase [bacterium]|uniref:Decaprenyl-phosphate phosphoribosyltransferase n=2 Tax=Katanobacteria TaxID=422282 RepID=A0A2M7X3N2_UNCKA|nr:decaprenyl-phosphate phosphoribosyltransferase [bacterium]PIP56405.1 MAG: decaprenyl-phosphate phosphoribosyltransferase [candidate division WWE3 bacterium CG22_combo_CG10-13_8_21_14_all_39_12]PJA40786.1 MAG: decaprenyl-phosphate phosphoribosyltransferase [candidate division WWE3 bacterium CG_4_9_14_3_um_filter_39_7]
MQRNVIRLIRVHQWAKNLLLFAALLFAQRLSDQDSLYLTILGFIAFSCAASATYVVNDIVDITRDRLHPVKKYRPLAAGVISTRQAWIIAGVLFVVSVGTALLVSPQFFAILMVYLILTTSYTKVLKHIELVDILIVSLGFVIRAVAGGVAIGVTISNWLFITTFFLALFLVIGKRRHEFLLLGDSASGTRKSLQNYTPQLLDTLLTIVSTASLLSYVLYTQAPDVVNRLGTSALVYTVPLVVYGLFRYLLLVYTDNKGEDPTRTLLTDKQIILTALLWGLSIIVIIYT